ncbi:MAG: 2Fe-2S iron-sulfur cluster-binding protein [Polyangiales bacterium]
MSASLHSLTVAGIVQETSDARSFLFEVPTTLRDRFQYRAGQFLTFEVPWRGLTLRRCYSLASAPEIDAWHKVTVKRVKEGRVSNWFNDELRVGDVIRTQAPEGRFILDSEAVRPLVLFGAGSGITPVISLLKSALATTARDVSLVYANRDRGSVIFADEIALLAARYPKRLAVHHHLDAERGFLTQSAVKPLLSRGDGADHYVCGPTPFMDLVEAALETAGVTHEHRHFERFVSPVDPDRRTPDSSATSPGAPSPATIGVRLDGVRREIPYAAGESLLQACKRSGVEAPSSCEDGFCGCCMAFLRSGAVTMPTHEALTDKDLARGWILPCQARAASSDAIEVDFDEKY